MRDRRSIHLRRSIVLALGLASPVMAAEVPDRVALVVGASNYGVPLVSDTRADAGDMATTLDELGFDVDLRFDLDQETLVLAVLRHVERTPHRGLGVVYLAGQVLAYKNEPFLLPVGVELKEPADLGDQGVRLDWIGRVLTRETPERRPEIQLLTIEGCVDSTFDLGMGPWPRKRDHGTPVFIAASWQHCAANKEGGVFTAAISRRLRNGGLTLDQVFEQAAREVKDRFPSLDPPAVKLSSPELLREISLSPSSTVAVRGAGGDHLTTQPSLPPFPWQPPQPSGFVPLSREQLTADAETAALGAVANRLEKALDQAGYTERAYFAAPGGFALVTRAERIDDAGRVPVNSRERRCQGPVVRSDFSLAGLISSVGSFVSGRFGRCRVLVLLVSDTNFSFDEPMTADQVAKVRSGGLIRVPADLIEEPFTGRHYAMLLAYELELSQVDKKLIAREAERSLDGQSHFQSSGLAAALGSAP